MGTSYDQIIQITISNETTSDTVISFSNILIFGKNPTITPRLKLYTADDMVLLASELTGGTAAAEYKAAVAVFAQPNHPYTLAIGRQGSGETEVEGLTAIQAENNDFYGVIYAAHDDTKADEIAAWVETNKKVFLYASNDTAIYANPDTSTIAYSVKNLAQIRTGVIYSADADVHFPDAGILSVLLPKEAGTYNPAYKTIAGVVPDALTGGQATIVHGKYASTYETVGGKNIFLFGQMGSGDYLDIVIFIDVLKTRLQEALYKLLRTQDKVSIEDGEGLAQVEQTMDEVFSYYQSVKAITKDAFDEDNVRTGGYTITVPTAASVSLADKAARILKNVKFTVFYASPVNTIQINGILTL